MNTFIFISLSILSMGILAISLYFSLSKLIKYLTWEKTNSIYQLKHLNDKEKEIAVIHKYLALVTFFLGIPSLMISFIYIIISSGGFLELGIVFLGGISLLFSFFFMVFGYGQINLLEEKVKLSDEESNSK